MGVACGMACLYALLCSDIQIRKLLYDNLTIKISSQKGQLKKKKPRLLPTLDELHSQRCADKATAMVIKTAMDRMRDTDNMTSVERLRDLHPDNILVWLIAKHGLMTIFSLMKALHSLRKSLTECRREAMLMQA